MSCYVVPDSHINVLVQWAAEHDALPAGLTKQDVAQLLYAANIRSVNARYGLAWSDAFTHEAPRTQPPEHDVALHLIERLDHQCDCGPGWEASTANNLLKTWSRLAQAGGAA